MKKAIAILPLSAFLLCGCGHPAWKDINKEDALVIIKKIKENYKMPAFYSAKDKAGDITFRFDDNQMFLGQTNPITGTKLYYVVGKDGIFYRLSYINGQHIKNIVAGQPDVQRIWGENKYGYLIHEDFAYTIFDEETLNSTLQLVDGIRKEHPDNPDEWAFYKFQSYDDASIHLEIMAKSEIPILASANSKITGNGQFVFEFENNRPAFVSKKVTIEGETGEDSLTYDYKTPIVIPEEANPETWDK